MKKFSFYLSLSLSAGALCHSTEAQVYRLTEQSFDNPAFREQFVASYLAVKSEINPDITPQEKTLFDEVVPLIQSDPAQAISRLKSAIKPDSSAAFDFILAQLLYQEDRMDDSVASYKEAIRKFPTYQMAYYNCGRALVAQGKFEDALAMFRKSMELKNADGTLFGLIGYCYLNLEQFSTALDAYRMAVMLAPNSRDWKLGKLQCHVALGQTDDAIGMLYEFIEKDPSNPEWWKFQANQFVNRGEPAKAAANLEVVRQLGKADGPTLVLLGDLLLNEGLFGPSQEIYVAALEKPNTRVDKVFRMVDTLVQFDEIPAAAALLAKAEPALAARLDEAQKTELLNVKARLALAKDNRKEAAGYLETIVARDPMNGRALLTLADYHSKEGDLAKAEFYADSAAKLDDYAHKANLMLAQLKVTQKNFREAARYLRRAQQINPQGYVADYLAKIEEAATRM